MLKNRKVISFSFFNIFLIITILFSTNSISAYSEEVYYPTLSYAICKCSKDCKKCMISEGDSQENSYVHCLYQNISHCLCNCYYTVLAPFSSENSHIWTDEKSAEIITVQKDKNNKIVHQQYVKIGKTSSNDKNEEERNCYYYIYGEKNKNGKVFYDSKKRMIGKYYIQELFEQNRTTENQYKLYITLPKVKMFSNGYYRIYGNTILNGNNCSIIKTNDKPLFVNFDDMDFNTPGYAGSSNISIKNISVNCTNVVNKKSSHYNSDFFYIAHCSNVNVDNVTVKNSKYTGHTFQVTGAENVTVSNCNFINLLYKSRNSNDKYTRENCSNKQEKTDGISGDLFYNCEVIQIEPDFSNTTNGQYFAVPTIKMSNDDTISKNVTIKYCNFENVVRAIGNHAIKVKICHHINIYGNVFNDIIGHAVILPRFNYVNVHNNTFNKISTSKIGGNLVYYGKYSKTVSMNVIENVMYNLYKNCKKIDVVDYWAKIYA